MLKYCTGFLVLCVVFAYEKVAQQNGHKSPQPFYELPCLSFGGICVAAGECAEDQLAKVSGLCPMQQRSGVECCHGLPISEKRCRERGGECMPLNTRCPENLTYHDASDCEADKKCCILVK